VNDDRTIAGIMLLLAALLCGGVVGWYLKPCDCPQGPAASSIEYHVDTVEHIVTRPPITITKALADTVRVHDTTVLYQTPAFTAALDTVLSQRDTVSATFDYPAYTFSVALRQAPDTVQIEHRTITLTNTNYERRPWWMDALTHVGAAALGYGVGTLTNP
jgi:hypothetical protein